MSRVRAPSATPFLFEKLYMHGQNNLVYIKLILVMTFWGSAFVSGRMLAQSYHSFSIAFMRFFLASFILIPFFLIKNKGKIKITLGQFFKLACLGLTGVFLYNYFFFNGLRLVEAGRSSIFISTNPAITTLMAALFLKEELSMKKVIGILLALFGALIVIGHGDLMQLFKEGMGLGEIYLMAAVLSWVIYTLLGKIILREMSPLMATTGATFLGSLFLLPFALQHNVMEMMAQSRWIDWLNLSNLGLLSTVLGFIWYYEGVFAIGAARTSSFINLIPIVGISFGVIFLNEKVSLSLIIGGLITICGILLINKSRVILKNS